METNEYIESGILELYVFGLLNESENSDIYQKAKNNTAIHNEIIAIEKAIVNLSTSFSPYLSAVNFEKIKSKLEIKHNNVIQLESKKNKSNYIGWAAAAVFLIGFGYQYNQQNIVKDKLEVLENQNLNLNTVVTNEKNKVEKTKELLNVIRDNTNTIVQLAGQATFPNANAKVYWNKAKQTVHIDASGLPKPPSGMVYQVWSLQLKPVLTPTSIGLLADFSEENSLIFAVENTSNAEAFGITLEPKGGSKTPTMEQLYVLGAV